MNVFFSFIDHDEMLKRIVGRIITKLAQRHSAWASYRASYPTMWIYDENLLVCHGCNVICGEIYDEIGKML
jgi:hypothetical protein